MLNNSKSNLNEFTFRLGCVEKHWNSRGKEIVDDSMINFIAEDHQFVCGLVPNIFGCPNMFCCFSVAGTHRRSNYAI